MSTKKSGKRKAKESDAAFDSLLVELHEATKAASNAKGSALVTREQRKERQATREAAAQQKKQEELQQMIDKQQQQQRLRALIERLIRQPTGLLPKPKTQIECESRNSNGISSSAAWMQGWREAMEDSHFMLPTFQGGALFGVFDGHAGSRCSALCRTALPAVILQSATPEGIDFNKVFLEMDATLKKNLNDESGSTAVVVQITDRLITCASVGDSRAVLRRAATAVPLTDDHKPERPMEQARILAAGGTVSQNRVNGQLAMSRALGDFQYKNNEALPVDQQLVVATPDVTKLERTKDDEFIVIACDGIFDVLTNEEVVEFVSSALKKTPNANLEDVCSSLCQRCLAPASENGGPSRAEGTDNMTVVIVKLNSPL